jgi:hypothetical protein
MTIEEKAKAYDEALGRAKALYAKGAPDSLHLEEMFPALKESEDERIRNFISNELACLRATDEKGSDRYEELTNAIAWLEKQGELVKEYEDKLGQISCESFDKGYKAAIEKQGEQKPINTITDSCCNAPDLPDDANFEIYSLWHAIRILEKTLGKVDGYQYGDGISVHKCAIEAVNRIYKQNLAE